ncbi:MAG: gamma-glutamylcyclotransferase family protein [Rhizomicrobium sp.]
MPHLFSYGTLQQENVQIASFGRALKGVPDALPGFRREMIEITDAEVFCVSGERFHPILVPSAASDEIAGMVFEVTDAELRRADAYEVADYMRIRAKLKSGLEAFVYVRAPGDG